MLWNQVYDPVGDPVLLTILAAVPIAMLLLGNLRKISAEQLGITPMLACLMGGFIMPQAYVPPFTALVIGGHSSGVRGQESGVRHRRATWLLTPGP